MRTLQLLLMTSGLVLIILFIIAIVISLLERIGNGT